MKKILLLIIIIFSYNVLAENISYSEKQKNQKEIDYKLESLFNAIRIFNNRYAMTFLKEDNIKKSNKKEEIGPNIINKNEEKKLKERLIDINLSNSQGYTPLIVAIEYNNDYILRELLSQGVKTNIKHPVLGKNILNTAVYYNNYNIVKTLIEYDKNLVNKSDNDGWTPIMNAVLKNNIDIINLLLNNNANPLQKDKNGENALELAIKYSKGEIIKKIKDHLKDEKRSKND